MLLYMAVSGFHIGDLNKAEFSNFFVLFFSLICMQKLDEPFRNKEFFYNFFFSIVQIWVLILTVFFQFLVDILALGSGSVNLNIFANSDPGSQKHCYIIIIIIMSLFLNVILKNLCECSCFNWCTF